MKFYELGKLLRDVSGLFLSVDNDSESWHRKFMERLSGNRSHVTSDN